jgi:hypothetical protein
MATPSQLWMHAKKIAGLQSAKKAAQAAVPSTPPIAPVTGSPLPVGTPPKSIDQMWEEAFAAVDPAYVNTLKKADPPIEEQGFVLAPLGEPVDPGALAAKPKKPKKSSKPPKKSTKPMDYDSFADDPNDPDLKAAMAGLDESQAAVDQGDKWTPAFSQKVWDYWNVTDPDFWMTKQNEAAKSLHELGVLDFEYDPTFGELVPYLNGYYADAGKVEKLAAKYLDPEFFHTEKGLPDKNWSMNSATGAVFHPREYYARPPEMGIREYVAKLREMSGDYFRKRGVARAVTALEAGFADAIKQGHITGFVPEDSGPAAALHNARNRDYLDYLAANGVDQRTIDAIAAGQLPMDPASRAQRAKDMGLDPDAKWYRWDSPLKQEMKGYTAAALTPADYRRKQRGALSFVELPPSREGLVYTSHNPEYAKVGVQVPKDEIVLYPLLGPRDGIAGIDEMSPQAYDAFAAKQAEALRKKYPNDPRLQRDTRRMDVLAEQLVDPGNWEPYHTVETKREANLAKLRQVPPGAKRAGLAGGTIPSYPTAETRKTYTEPLMASGAKGTLVKDETGVATAFTPSGARMLRNADLAPLDPRFRLSRNILQSLLVPAVIAAGASQQQQGVLSGLKETR